jgi:hypothetical protein
MTGLDLVFTRSALESHNEVRRLYVAPKEDQ